MSRGGGDGGGGISKDTSCSSSSSSSSSSTWVVKQRVCERSTIPKRVSQISFEVGSVHDVRRMSSAEILVRNLYEADGSLPAKHGCLDTRLGTSSKQGICSTCGHGVQECVGHFGNIRLHLPVFHIGYIKHTIDILQCICKTCSALLIIPSARASAASRMRRCGTDRLERQSVFKLVVLLQSKKIRKCWRCDAFNGPVKKLRGAFRVVHEPFRHKLADEIKQHFVDEFVFAKESNTEIETHVGKAVHDMTPLIVLQLFKRIAHEDLDLLDMSCTSTRPEDLLLQHIPVPPVCIRPSVKMGTSGTNEDDLTVKLADIVYINRYIGDMMLKGAATASIVENWDFLQQQCAMYINSDLPGFPKNVSANPGKPIRALTQRLKGKHGRFRGNLSGKRVDFSARTVISPDPNLDLTEVGIPLWTAKKMTFPERVTSHNIEMLRCAIRNGPENWPGANFVERHSDGRKMMLRYGDRNKIADMLCLRDIVERHLHDGDIVLFNRQPSLHRISIMSHRARVLPFRTFRFNPCACNPYNADFDGDEMNLHLPQTQEARAEATLLMGVQNNVQTPRDGTPLVTLLQDFLTACYLLTHKDVFYDRARTALITSYFSNATEHVVLPLPCIMKPVEMWSGKQIFSVLLRPNPEWACITLELKERNYTSNEYMCARDGYIVIRNSELLCGNLGKSCLGGSKKGLIYVIVRDHSSLMAAKIMSRLAKLSARWLGNRGFSIGIDDVTPPTRLVELKAKLLEDGYASCSKTISEFNKGELSPQPGCNEEETLESILLGVLSKIRDEAGQTCLRELPYLYNSPLIMAVCGSKGSPLNISQMVACVGQQSVGGTRIPNGFVNRSLPHFARYSRTPAAKGFVPNSFFSGLTATEFFFHTMGGREGLVDTAVKTAETGYMQRRLMKSLEDVCSHYDNSVRTSTMDVVQFKYGDDGLDPIMLDKLGPVNFSRLLDALLAADSIPHENALTSNQIKCILNEVLSADDFKPHSCSKQFVDELKAFVENIVTKLSNVESMYTNITCQKLLRLTATHLSRFFDRCLDMYHKARIEPGTAVGAIGAQSIGEPGTQMTLKTFHFAGVASMNITLGVPRIKEIINATKNIKTPIINATLVVPNDERVARIVKMRVETTTLGGIAEFIETVVSKAVCYVRVKIDMKAIEALQLETCIDRIRDKIVAHKILKLKINLVSVQSSDELRVYAPDNSPERMLFVLHRLCNELPNVVVQGIESVSRAVIKDVGKGELRLLVEGQNLREVMGTCGVDGYNTTSNHILEVEATLGIEAARKTIADEIQTTMEGHGLTVDARHVMLLADIMSYKGKILGITRFGISKMKSSVLMLASFEKTTDHLFHAAVRGATDDVCGVSESIIMGVPMPIGSGLFKLLHQVDKPYLHQRQPLLMDTFTHNHHQFNTDNNDTLVTV